MASTQLLTTIVIATAFASAATVAQFAQAQPDQTAVRVAANSQALRSAPALQALSNSNLPQQASYGWKYFRDPRAAHAVVISPAGEYFLSLGDGLQQIIGPAGDVLKARRAQH